MRDAARSEPESATGERSPKTTCPESLNAPHPPAHVDTQ